LVFLVAVVEVSFLGAPTNTTIPINGDKARSAILPVTYRYRGGQLSDDGGALGPSSPDNPFDFYSLVAAASAFAILGTLSAYLLVRWNAKQKLRTVLKSLREQ
jgi:hypothetical protein